MDRRAVAHWVRSPRAAAIAGIIFGGILATMLVLLNSAAPATVADSGRWVTDRSLRSAVVSALTLIPHAGIAFL